MVWWLSLSGARWLLWWGDRGLWWTPLGGPQKAASPPSPACRSPHLGPGVTPCGRAAVNCRCWLVKRHSEGSGMQSVLEETLFSHVSTRGCSATVKRGGPLKPADTILQGICSYLLHMVSTFSQEAWERWWLCFEGMLDVRVGDEEKRGPFFKMRKHQLCTWKTLCDVRCFGPPGAFVQVV